MLFEVLLRTVNVSCKYFSYRLCCNVYHYRCYITLLGIAIFPYEYVTMDYLVASLKNVQKGQLDLCLSFWDRKTSKAAAMY